MIVNDHMSQIERINFFFLFLLLISCVDQGEPIDVARVNREINYGSLGRRPGVHDLRYRSVNRHVS